MLSITIDQEPVFQKRPRSSGGRFYNPDHDEKMRWKWMVANQIRNEPKLRPGAPLHVDATYFLPIASSLSEVKRKALEGEYHTQRGDVDNLLKFSFDAMNGIAYKDDCLIASVYAEKRFSVTTRAEFKIYELGGVMIQEHAKTVGKEITPADLEYMVKKANHLGLQHREIFHVFITEDGDGRHVYYECDAPREH
jgi:Holliday junction resolvase RusA-like endonuclease